MPGFWSSASFFCQDQQNNQQRAAAAAAAAFSAQTGLARAVNLLHTCARPASVEAAIMQQTRNLRLLAAGVEA
jgi:hypothetical protein